MSNSTEKALLFHEQCGRQPGIGGVKDDGGKGNKVNREHNHIHNNKCKNDMGKFSIKNA